MFKHILIATDGSPISRKAAKAGVALASALGAKVTGYNAVDPMRAALYAEGDALDETIVKRLKARARRAGQKRVDAIGKIAKAAGVPFASVVSQADTPYQGIIDAAKREKCDVIFMASHGRRGFSRLIMGSITQKVLMLSKTPVVVYR